MKLRLRWWTSPTRADVVHVKSEVLRAIRKVANDRGFDMPFPTQVVLFHDQTDENDGDRARQREGWPSRPGDRGGNPRPRPLAGLSSASPEAGPADNAAA